ncbi:polyprenyl synthetase family protein [soil metagenome]
MTVSSLAELAKGRVEPALLEQISREVALVEEELLRQMGSRVSIVQDANSLTLKAGGKRLRPAFVTLAAMACVPNADLKRTRRLGACMEMIHMATLLHDDVIDGSTTRRGKPTALAAFGGTAAILSGDVLLAKAMVLLAQDGDIDVIRTVSEATIEIAEGEVREMEYRGQFDLDEDAHIEVLRLKTASFIQCCCEVGGIIANATPAQRLALRRFGHHVGLAFQIADDLLDYRGTATGKPRAIDFRDAQATLPLIYLKPELTESEERMTRSKFGNGVTDDEIRLIVEWMSTRGAFAKAEERAKRQIELALEQLDDIPEGPSKDLLKTVADYVIVRPL